MRLVLFQPDIPQNTGTIMRLGACFGLGVDIVEPCGFVLDDRRLKRSAMDYIDHLDWRRWPSWSSYRAGHHDGRLVLLTTRSETPHTEFNFDRSDRLLLGRESAGAPEEVHAVADARIKIPLKPPARSLNVALAAAIVAGEAMRQTGSFDTGSFDTGSRVTDT